MGYPGRVNPPTPAHRVSFFSLASAAAAAAATALVLGGCPPPAPTPIDLDDGDPPAADCQAVTLGPVTFSFQDDVSTHFEALLETPIDTPAPDHLVLQFFNYNERIGDLGVGAFPLDDATNDNYGHCAECLLVLADQLGPNDVPGRTFFQSGGTLTLTSNPRDTRDLFGSLRGLTLVESTIGGDALESAPVPGGACLTVADLDLDLRFVPANWTCAPEAYNAGDGVCDCGCGEADADCFVDFGAPPPATVTGCEAGQACLFDVCVDVCDALGGVGCAGGDVCAIGDPQDVCETDPGRVDPAALGEACSDDFVRFLCGVSAGIATGLCDVDVDGDGNRRCAPLCGSAADCAPGEFCFTIVGGSKDGTGKGYCAAE